LARIFLNENLLQPMSRFYGDICKLGSASCWFSCFSLQKTTECGSKYFQGVSKDKNMDKTVKPTTGRYPKEASSNWNRTRKLSTQNGKLGLPDYNISKKKEYSRTSIIRA